MIDKLKAFLFSNGDDAAADDGQALALATAVLLAEAGLMDGSLGQEERAAIVPLLARRFAMDAAAASALLERGLAEAERNTNLYSWARRLKDGLDYEERIDVVEMLWEVVYADGALHDYEANLMRRLAGLLYVDDQDSGAARKRAMDRLGLA
jgi:uncharacterized tellurite resistance protein B-like protein